MDRKDLVKEIQRVRKNLTRRFARIEKRFGDSPALASFKNLNLDLSVRGKSEKELRALLGELNYYEGLKTSSVKGTETYKIKFEKLEKILKADENLQNKFWTLYSKFVEENGLIEKYKYDVFDIIYNELLNNSSEDEIREKINKMFEENYNEEEFEKEDKVTLDDII